MDGSQLFVPAPTDENLSGFQFGEVENEAAVNTRTWFFVWTSVCISENCWVTWKCMLNIKRNCQTALPDGSAILQTQQ